MQLCKTGTPDRVFNYIVNVWIEFKRPGEKPSPEQTATIAKLRENGSLAFVVDNVSDFDLILRAIKARQARLLEIGERIRDIQGEIDAELLTQNYGKKQKHNPHI